jgi:sulfur-oxidizing protein SoxY
MSRSALPVRRGLPAPPLAGGVSRRACGGALLQALVLPAAWAQLPAGDPRDNPESNVVWQGLRRTLFGTRPITAAAADTLLLEAPVRAVDAAVVPIAIRSRLPQTAQQHVRRLLLVIDGNPSPVGLIVQFGAEAGRAEIETRVRVDEYSHVRAIAETNDGQLYMAVRYVKASGGCSAPAAGDARAALARLGQMRLQVEPAAVAGGPQAVQLQVSHPNHSGMAMDQATRQFTPAQFVRQIDVTLAGRPVLSAQVDFSLSENPHLRFYVQPGRGGELLVRVSDTEDRQFSASTLLAGAAP